MIREPSILPTAPRLPGKFEGRTPLAVFLVLALAIGAVGYAVFAHLEASIRQEKYQELGAIGDLKVRQLEEWLGERRGDATAVAKDPILAQEVRQWLERGAPRDEAARRIEARLQGLRQAYNYAKVILVDREARPVLVAGDALSRRAHPESNQRAAEAMRTGQPLLSDLHLEAETDGAPAKANLDVYTPLVEADGRVVGAVYFEIDPERFLFPFVQSWPTASESAETWLFRRDGDDVLYLNQLRHQKNSPLVFRLPMNSPELPSARALRGETGVVEGVDYRGVRVLAALRTVTGTAWHLVAKIDQAEVFAPMRNLAIGMGAMVAVLLAGSGLLVMLWWRRQQAQVLVMHYEAEFERAALSKHLELMSRHANDAIFLYDEAGRILEANERAVERYGYPRGELIGMSARQLRAPGAASDAREEARLANEAGSSIYETLHRRKDGGEFPVEASLQVIDVEGRRLTQAIVRDITERRRAQEVILQEKNFIGAALESLPGLFYVIDDQGCFLRWNWNFESVSGYSPDEISRLSPMDLFTGADKEIIAERIRQVFLTGEATAEADFVAKNQTRTPYFFTGKRFEIDQKPHLIGMGIDITTRKRAEEKQRSALQLLDSIVENIPTAVQLKSVEDGYRVQMWNKAAEAMYGVPRQDAIGRNVHDLWPKSDADRFHAADLELVASGRMQDFPDRPALTTDRGEIRVHMRKVALFDAAGKATHLLVIADDITARLADQARLRESEERHRAIAESASEVVLVIDADSLITYVNPAIEPMFGYGRDELIGQSLTALMPEELRSSHLRGLKRYLDTGQRSANWKSVEVRGRHKDGREFPIEISFGEFVQDGKPAFTGFIRDVTEHKRAVARIERLSRLKDALSGVNNAIVHAEDEQSLFDEICSIMVTRAGFDNAGIRIVDRDSGQIRAVAGVGPATAALEQARRSVRSDQPEGRGLTGTALHERSHVICQDFLADPRTAPWHDIGRTYGIASAAAFPILRAGAAVGTITVFSNAVNAFDDEAVALLDEAAQDVSFALDNLDGEAERKRIEEALLESEERFRGLTELSADYYWRQDEQFRFLERASSPHEKGSFPTGTVIGKTRWELPALNMTEADWTAHRAELAAHKEFRGLELERPLPDGQTRWISVSGRPIFDRDGQFKGYRGIGVDITERKQADERIRRLNRIYAVLSGINSAIVRAADRALLLQEACRIAVESGGFGIAQVLLVDEGKLEIWSGPSAGIDRFPAVRGSIRPGAETISGQGTTFRAIRERKPVFVNDITAEPAIDAVRAEALQRGYGSVISLPLVVGERVVAVLVLCTKEKGFFDSQELRLLEELAGDIAFSLDTIEKKEKLDYLAFYDPLTGLANRALFVERLNQSIRASGPSGGKFALAMLDLERLATINDSLGRQAGDELIKLVAQRLQTSVGPASAGRISADHFALILGEVSGRSQASRIVGDALRKCFGESFDVGGTELRLSAKAGVAQSPGDGTDAETLLRNAEAALRKAKDLGEQHVLYTPALTERTAGQLTLENRLRQALEKQEFVLHYQPKVELETRRIVGVEALIRWQSPELGLVPPMKFIPLMEETGLILEAGTWALKQAARDHRKWFDLGLSAPRVAVNVSAIQLRQRDFVAAVERAIHEGAVPTGIDLEITESLIMEDVQASIEKLKAVRGLEVGIAIDDFGTGYSSLGYLAKLPVQTLKIDRSFIITMLTDPDTMMLVSTIISLAHSFRLTVVAEGVEEEEQAKMLRLLRCDQMQGYLFSRPVPYDQMTVLLAQ